MSGIRSDWAADAPTLLIFDCDGVLIESEPLAIRIEVAELTKLGWPITEAEVIERFVGRSEQFICAEIAARLGADVASGWMERFARLYHAACETELRRVDDVVDALDQITIPSCVASSTNHETLRHVLTLVGLYERFAGRIFSVSEVSRGKPAPDIFLHAAARLGADPRACVVIEDSRHGVEAGRAAGMRVLAYAGGLTPAERLEGPRTTVFTDMRDLPRLLARLTSRT